MSKSLIIQFESELSSSQQQLLREKHLTLESVVFLTCTQLRKNLKGKEFSPEEEKQLKKLRKRGREKWLNIRECEYLEGDIMELQGTARTLKAEKLQLEEEIGKLKIMCFLAAPDNTVYNCDVGSEVLHDINEQDIMQCFSGYFY